MTDPLIINDISSTSLLKIIKQNVSIKRKTKVTTPQQMYTIYLWKCYRNCY